MMRGAKCGFRNEIALTFCTPEEVVPILLPLAFRAWLRSVPPWPPTVETAGGTVLPFILRPTISIGFSRCAYGILLWLLDLSGFGGSASLDRLLELPILLPSIEYGARLQWCLPIQQSRCSRPVAIIQNTVWHRYITASGCSGSSTSTIMRPSRRISDRCKICERVVRSPIWIRGFRCCRSGHNTFCNCFKTSIWIVCRHRERHSCSSMICLESCVRWARPVVRCQSVDVPVEGVDIYLGSVAIIV